MFDLSTAPANSRVAKKWLAFAGANTVTSGAVTLSTVIDQIKNIFPESVLKQLPNYEQFFYLALGIAFVAALPLLFIRKVVCVSLAQLGFVSSLLYLTCALGGVFAHGFEKVLLILLVVMVGVFIVLFIPGISFAIRQKSWSDVVLGIGLLLVFVIVWVYPLNKIWSHQ